MARAMADAAAVPTVEFTVCDTFAAPRAVLTLLPKVPVDTAARQEGYLERLAGLGDLLVTVAHRHREAGTLVGRPWPGSSARPWPSSIS